MPHLSRTVTAAFVITCSAASCLAATPQLPMRRAFAATPTEHPQGCLGGASLTHAAYLPANAAKVAGCGHFLSTDTLVTVHRWDRT